MKRLALSLVILLWVVSPIAWAQDARPAPPHDPIGEQVLPPELIMQNQRAIGLTDAQRSGVLAEIKRAQALLVDREWELQRAMGRLVELLGVDKPDEKAVSTQLDAVLALEHDIKQAHLTLAVRLKNLLTPEQQRTLRELRGAAPQSADAPRKR